MGSPMVKSEPLPSLSVLGELAWARPSKKGIYTPRRRLWLGAVSSLSEESWWDGWMKDVTGGFPNSGPGVFRLQGPPRQESQGEERSPREVSSSCPR